MPSFWEILRVQSSGDLLDDMSTYTSLPSEPGTLPAVIVVQEVFGVNKHIQAVADRFAEAGYFAVAPALFHREGTTEEVRGTNPVFSYGDASDVEVRGKAVSNLRDENIILDINTIVEWLRRHPRVSADRIGIVGFCAGGRITYLAAAACPGIGAAVVFYGGNTMKPWGDGPTPFQRISSVGCPVMGNFGDRDPNPAVDDVGKIESELKKHGKIYDFKMYRGAGHGFFCEERDSYHEASAKDAWDRTLGWFQKHLPQVVTTTA